MSIRSNELHKTDITLLGNYYKSHGHFPLFTQVLIETRTDCNNNCPFCPQAYVKKELGVMSWNCYTTIIDQLASIGFNGRIALMLSNEPLLENRLEQMIAYAKHQSQRFFLDITTNGRLLTVEKVDNLFSLGLDNININDYRSDRDEYPERWSSHIIPLLEAFSNNPKVDFKRRRFDESLPNYAGNIPQKFNTEDFGFCNYPFRKLTIAYNGNILLCCDDFVYDTCFGNVLNDSLVDCWNHPHLEEIKKSLLENKRIGICERCNDSQDYNTF